MRFTVEGPSSACNCGWKPPKNMTLMPTLILKSYLSVATGTKGLSAFLEAVLVTCPGCGAEMKAGEARIVGV